MGRQPVQLDPLRGLRGIFAGTLVMEAIVVGLALLVVNRIGAGFDDGRLVYRRPSAGHGRRGLRAAPARGDWD